MKSKLNPLQDLIFKIKLFMSIIETVTISRIILKEITHIFHLLKFLNEMFDGCYSKENLNTTPEDYGAF